MPQPLDPFTRAHQAIWTALLASDEWTALVKAGNRLDMEGDGKIREIIKKARTPADYSEVSIDQSRFAGVPWMNSKTAGVSQVFIVSLATGSVKVLKLNELKWATLRALFRAGPELNLSGLVHAWSVTSATDHDSIPGETKPGYSSVLAINVEMYVPHASLY